MKSITSKKAARALPFPRLNDNKYTWRVRAGWWEARLFVGAAILAVLGGEQDGAQATSGRMCAKRRPAFLMRCSLRW